MILGGMNIPDILLNIPLMGKGNVTGAIPHVLLGLFLLVLFVFIGFKFFKSAQKESEK